MRLLWLEVHWLFSLSEGGRRVAVMLEPLEVNFSSVLTSIVVWPADVQLAAIIWRPFSTCTCIDEDIMHKK